MVPITSGVHAHGAVRVGNVGTSTTGMNANVISSLINSTSLASRVEDGFPSSERRIRSITLLKDVHSQLVISSLSDLLDFCRRLSTAADDTLAANAFLLLFRFYSVLNYLGLYNKNAKILFLVSLFDSRVCACYVHEHLSCCRDWTMQEKQR